MKTLALAAALTLAGTAAFAADVKQYQVTGPIVEITPTLITVQKGKENWQLQRGSASLPDSLKPGDKVTVKYFMTAAEIKGSPKQMGKTGEIEKSTLRSKAAKDSLTPTTQKPLNPTNPG